MNVTLSSAIRRTVAEILDISEKSISIPIISPKRRMLLSGVYVTYDLNVTSYRTPEWYKSTLTESVEKGHFITLLSSKAGVVLGISYDLHFDDYSPTSRPISSPSFVLSKQAGMQTIMSNIIDSIICDYTRENL